MSTSRKFSTNSIEGQEKNYNLILLNCVFSKIFRNVALAVGLCIVTKKEKKIEKNLICSVYCVYLQQLRKDEFER